MQFTKASFFFLFCASVVSAFPHERAVPRAAQLLQDEPAAKLIARKIEIEKFDRREAVAEPDAYARAEPEGQFEGLDRRDPISDAHKEILEYLRQIKTSGSGGIGGPAKWPSSWSDLHGDNKSKFGGRYVCQVRLEGSTYEARVIAHANQGNNIKKGYVFGTTNVDACKDKKGHVTAPSYGRAIHFLRKAFGGENPPAC